MTVPIRPADDALMRELLLLKQQVYALQRGLSSGRRSIGIDALKPASFNGTPLSMTGTSRYAIGTQVLDTSTGKVFFRVSEGVGPTFTGVWKSVTPA